MARVRYPFADKQNNRTYLNTSDYLLLNAYVENGPQGACIVKRPGWKLKKAVSTIVSNARGFIYSDPHSLFYCVIGDALFKISPDLTTVTEIARKEITNISYSAAAGGTWTYTFAAAHGFIATQSVKISGVTPTGYTGVKTIAAVTTVSVANDSFTVTGVGADIGAETLTNAYCSPILTETGKVYFEQTISATVQNTMLLIPKTASYNSQLFMIASGGTVTRVTDTDLPVDLLGSPAAIDGYLCVLSEAESEINNSDLETPTSYNALGYVSADTYPDSPVSLSAHHNQLVCFKEYSTEFFYNAAIAAPASPLAKIPQQTLTIGCASAATVVKIGNQIIWVSRNQNGGLGVHILSGGNAQKISTIYIDKILSSLESFIFGDEVESFYASVNGHDFYILTVDGTVGTNQAIAGIAVAGISIAGLGGTLNTYKRTLVYDLTENQWHEWSSYDPVTLEQASFFGSLSVSGPHVGTSQDFTNMLIMERDTGDIYEMSPPPIGASYGNTYKDGTRTITVKAVTNRLDGGTRNRKRHNSLEIIGDRSTSSTTLNVRYSDDDYQSWSTSRSVDLSGRARLNNLGSFRERAFEFTHADDTALRLNAIELDVMQMER